MADEFYNFEEALNQLNLKEEELKRLVSEGEIRAFRKGDTMKLRRSDVEELRGELMGGEVIDLGGAGEELVFEDDLDLEDPGMATEEISEMDTLLDDDVEDVGEVELEVDDEPAPRRSSASGGVRRTGAIAAAQEEEVGEGMLIRMVTLATTAVLILAIPIVVSIAKGSTSDIARAIAGMFGAGE